MRTRNFSGSFFEIGKQQGKIYSRKGMSFESVKINPELLKNQLKVYKRFYPGMLEEFDGMAESGGFDKNKLIYNFICGEILWFTKKFGLKKACTIFGLKKKNGVFVGRNYDWIPSTEKFFEAYRVVNLERNSFVALTDMGIGMNFGNEVVTQPKQMFYNADDVINDKGLFIGLTFAYNDKWSYGLSCIHMTKLIAETCSTLKEALDVFKKVPLCCPKNFFVADKNGDMAAIEHTSKRFKVIYPENGVLIHTNHYVDQELAKEDTVLTVNPAHNTFLRYYETLQKLNLKKGVFRLSDAIKILGNTKSCVCQNGRKIKTIWSLAMDMKNRNYKAYWDLMGKRKVTALKI